MKLIKVSESEVNVLDPNVVVLHQFWMGKFCPNLSPFVIKVECFMRLAGILYVRDFKKPFGSKKLCPWITINGTQIPDSQQIIEYLSEHFSINLDLHLKPERIAAVESARIMLEQQIFWVLYLHRYYFDKSKVFVTTQVFPKKYIKYFFMCFMPRRAYKKGLCQGMAYHTETEQFNICKKAFVYLDALLGDETFFGGAKPCTADCSIFGFLMQFKWNAPGTMYEKLITEDFPRLEKYCLSMKEKMYPDWNDVLNPPV